MILRFRHPWKSWSYEIESTNIFKVHDHPIYETPSILIELFEPILDPESFWEDDIQVKESYEDVMKIIETAKFSEDFEEHLK